MTIQIDRKARFLPDHYKSFPWPSQLLIVVASLFAAICVQSFVTGSANTKLRDALISADILETAYRSDPTRLESAASERAIDRCQRLAVLVDHLKLPVRAETRSQPPSEFCRNEYPNGGVRVPDELLLLDHLLDKADNRYREDRFSDRTPTVALLTEMLRTSPSGYMPQIVEPTVIEDLFLQHLDVSGYSLRVAQVRDALGLDTHPEGGTPPSGDQDIADDSHLLELMFARGGWLSNRGGDHGSDDWEWCVFAPVPENGPITLSSATYCSSTGELDLESGQQRLLNDQREAVVAFFEAALAELRAVTEVRAQVSWATMWTGGVQTLIIATFLYALVYTGFRLIATTLDWRAVRRGLLEIGDEPLTPQRTQKLFGVRQLPKSIARLAADELHVGFIGLERWRSELEAQELRLRSSAWPITTASALLPILGFIGTVLGIMQGLSRSDTMVRADGVYEQAAAVLDVAGSLGLAFGTTLLALSGLGVLILISGVSNGLERGWITRLDTDFTHRLAAAGNATERAP